MRETVLSCSMSHNSLWYREPGWEPKQCLMSNSIFPGFCIYKTTAIICWTSVWVVLNWALYLSQLSHFTGKWVNSVWLKCFPRKIPEVARSLIGFINFYFYFCDLNLLFIYFIVYEITVVPLFPPLPPPLRPPPHFHNQSLTVVYVHGSSIYMFCD